MNRGYLELIAMQQGIERFLEDAKSLHSGNVATSKLFAKYRNVHHFTAAIKTIVRVNDGYRITVEKYSKMLDDLKSNVENISEIIVAIEEVESVIQEEKASSSIVAVLDIVEQPVVASPVRKKRNKKKIKN
jgi:hypothetical protein